MFGQGISGTMMRKHIAADDWKTFIENTPLKKDRDKLRAWQIVTGKIQPTPQAMPALEETLFRMVEQSLNEVESEKQRRWACAQLGDDFKGERKLTKKQA